MTMFRRFGSFLVAAVLTLAAAPAHATHIPGATYTGTAATGGTVSFDVSALGGAVTRFAWSDVPTDCGTSTGNFTGSIPIIGHVFSQAPGRRVLFSGAFPASQQATGTLGTGPRKSLDDGCTFSAGWTATTTAIAPPPTPDRTPPAADISAGNRLGRDGVIRVRVGCPEEACGVMLGGKVSIAGQGTQVFRLKRVRAPINHGATGVLRAELGRRGLAAARRALANGRRVVAKVAVTVVDPAGNRRVERLRLRLRR
jgi:hypothetical protein